MLTKEQEMALLAKIVEQCPDGYVRDILRDIQPGIVDAIKDDLGFVDWRSGRQEVQKLKDEESALRNSIRELEKTRNQMLFDCEQLTDRLVKFRHSGERLAEFMRQFDPT